MATRWSRSAVTQQAAGAFLVIQWARWLAPVGRMTAVVRAKDPVAMAVVGGEEEETTPSMMVAVMVTKLEARARMTELGGAARDRMVESSAWGCWEAAVAATEAAMATVMVVILAMVEDVETRIHQAVVARVMEVKGRVTAVVLAALMAEPRAVVAVVAAPAVEMRAAETMVEEGVPRAVMIVAAVRVTVMVPRAWAVEAAEATEGAGTARAKLVGELEAAVAAKEAAMATVVVAIVAMVEDVETRIHQAVVARVMEGVETAGEVKEAVAKAVEVEEAVVKASVVKGMVTAVERGGVEAEPRAVAAPTVAT